MRYPPPFLLLSYASPFADDAPHHLQQILLYSLSPPAAAFGSPVHPFIIGFLPSRRHNPTGRTWTHSQANAIEHTPWLPLVYWHWSDNLRLHFQDFCRGSLPKNFTPSCKRPILPVYGRYRLRTSIHNGHWPLPYVRPLRTPHPWLHFPASHHCHVLSFDNRHLITADCAFIGRYWPYATDKSPESLHAIRPQEYPMIWAEPYLNQ